MNSSFDACLDMGYVVKGADTVLTENGGRRLDNEGALVAP